VIIRSKRDSPHISDKSLPIQTINGIPVLKVVYFLSLLAFLIIGLLSLRYKFYASKYRIILIGFWLGSFVSPTGEIFLWISGLWELINTVFNIVLPLYFITLYQVLEAIYGKPVEDVI
jgi:hypothetical protein